MMPRPSSWYDRRRQVEEEVDASGQDPSQGDGEEEASSPLRRLLWCSHALCYPVWPPDSVETIVPTMCPTQ